MITAGHTQGVARRSLGPLASLRVWPAFAVQPLPLSQGAPPPPGAGSKFRHLHPRFRGPDPETTSRPTEKRSASQSSIDGEELFQIGLIVCVDALADVSLQIEVRALT